MNPPVIQPCSSILDVGDSATAISFCLDNSQSHALTVKRLHWRPRARLVGQGDGEEGEGRVTAADSSWVQLASAGADHCQNLQHQQTGCVASVGSGTLTALDGGILTLLTKTTGLTAWRGEEQSWGWSFTGSFHPPV